MGGKSPAYGRQQDLVRMQTDTSKAMIDWSQQRTAKMDELRQPTIDFNRALAGGDRGAMNTALAPAISGVTKAYEGSKRNLLDTVQPGAGREYALGNLERDRANSTAALPGNTFQSALQTLANLGGQEGQFALQQLGAGLRSGEAATQTNSSLMQADQARKATQLGLLGSLAGVGGFATAGLLGRKTTDPNTLTLRNPSSGFLMF